MSIDDLVLKLTDENEFFTKVIAFALQEIVTSQEERKVTPQLEEWLSSIVNYVRKRNLTTNRLIAALRDIASDSDPNSFNIKQALAVAAHRGESPVKLPPNRSGTLLNRLSSAIRADMDGQDLKGPLYIDSGVEEQNGGYTVHHPDGNRSSQQTKIVIEVQSPRDSGRNLGNSSSRRNQRTHQGIEGDRDESDRLSFGSNSAVQKVGNKISQYSEVQTSRIQILDKDGQVIKDSGSQVLTDSNQGIYNSMNIGVTEDLARSMRSVAGDGEEDDEAAVTKTVKTTVIKRSVVEEGEAPPKKKKKKKRVKRVKRVKKPKKEPVVTTTTVVKKFEEVVNELGEIETREVQDIEEEIVQEENTFQIDRTILDTTLSRMDRDRSNNRIYEGSETVPESYTSRNGGLSDREGRRSSRNSVIMRTHTIQASNEEDVHLNKRSGYIDVSPELIERQAYASGHQAYHPRPPKEVQHFKVVDESNAKHSDLVSEKASAYVRVHKPHKQQMYVIDGHKKYPDGHQEIAKIKMEDYNKSPYNEATVLHKAANPVPYENCDHFVVDDDEVQHKVLTSQVGASPHRRRDHQEPSFKSNYGRRKYINKRFEETDLDDYDKKPFVEETKTSVHEDVHVSHLRSEAGDMSRLSRMTSDFSSARRGERKTVDNSMYGKNLTDYKLIREDEHKEDPDISEFRTEPKHDRKKFDAEGVETDLLTERERRRAPITRQDTEKFQQSESERYRNKQKEREMEEEMYRRSRNSQRMLEENHYKKKMEAQRERDREEREYAQERDSKRKREEDDYRRQRENARRSFDERNMQSNGSSSQNGNVEVFRSAMREEVVNTGGGLNLGAFSPNRRPRISSQNLHNSILTDSMVSTSYKASQPAFVERSPIPDSFRMPLVGSPVVQRSPSAIYRSPVRVTNRGPILRSGINHSSVSVSQSPMMGEVHGSSFMHSPTRGVSVVQTPITTNPLPTTHTTTLHSGTSFGTSYFQSPQPSLITTTPIVSSPIRTYNSNNNLSIIKRSPMINESVSSVIAPPYNPAFSPIRRSPVLATNTQHSVVHKAPLLAESPGRLSRTSYINPHPPVVTSTILNSPLISSPIRTSNVYPRSETVITNPPMVTNSNFVQPHTFLTTPVVQNSVIQQSVLREPIIPPTRTTYVSPSPPVVQNSVIQQSVLREPIIPPTRTTYVSPSPPVVVNTTSPSFIRTSTSPTPIGRSYVSTTSPTIYSPPHNSRVVTTSTPPVTTTSYVQQQPQVSYVEPAYNNNQVTTTTTTERVNNPIRTSNSYIAPTTSREVVTTETVGSRPLDSQILTTNQPQVVEQTTTEVVRGGNPSYVEPLSPSRGRRKVRRVRKTTNGGNNPYLEGSPGRSRSRSKVRTSRKGRSPSRRSETIVEPVDTRRSTLIRTSNSPSRVRTSRVQRSRVPGSPSRSRGPGTSRVSTSRVSRSRGPRPPGSPSRRRGPGTSRVSTSRVSRSRGPRPAGSRSVSRSTVQRSRVPGSPSRSRGPRPAGSRSVSRSTVSRSRGPGGQRVSRSRVQGGSPSRSRGPGGSRVSRSSVSRSRRPGSPSRSRGPGGSRVSRSRVSRSRTPGSPSRSRPKQGGLMNSVFGNDRSASPRRGRPSNSPSRAGRSRSGRPSRRGTQEGRVKNYVVGRARQEARDPRNISRARRLARGQAGQ